jgi:hypothetical protein
MHILQQHDGAWERGPPLALNIGGYCLDIKRNTIMQAPNSMLARMSSGDWDHVLPHDTAGRIFLDLDEKWVKPIFQHLFHLSLAHDSNEPLSTPESSFEDSDDLMGYYATLDFFGLTDIFYPDGIEPVQIPLGMIKPQLFIQKVQPQWWKAVTGEHIGICYIKAPEMVTTLNHVKSIAKTSHIQLYSSKSKTQAMYTVATVRTHDDTLRFRECSQERTIQTSLCLPSRGQQSVE